MECRTAINEQSYVNPVLDRPCADPFVLKYLNEYWCYSTGIQTDGRCFGAFHSRDLVNWRELGGVIEPVEQTATCYWAPEVIYENGRFFMYYSVGDGDRMHIRVATAGHPAGPFVDAGIRLTTEEFAIDPHPFRDEDGTWYLFYATDFLQHTHIGTGTVCDVMLDFCTLKGEAQIVSRAKYDWQIFDPARKERGGVRWHTVEGPFVVKHKGTYYQMFSAGNWKNQSYGVSYAVSRTITANQEWDQFADGERILPILRTIPGKVIGPGHNSAIRGPDNVQPFCIYHRWSSNLSDRVLAIDRLDWAGDRLLVIGATDTPQPAPSVPVLSDFFDENSEDGLGENWIVRQGNWSVRDNMAVASYGDSEARCKAHLHQFILEVTIQSLQKSDGAFGIKLGSDDGTSLSFELRQANNTVALIRRSENGEELAWKNELTLPDEFDMRANHLVRIEAGCGCVKIALDGYLMKWEHRLPQGPDSVALFTSKASAGFRGFALTHGWQDLFLVNESDPGVLGWESDGGDWLILDNELRLVSKAKKESAITKFGLPDAYELVVNARLYSDVAADETFGFFPAIDRQQGPLLTVGKLGEGWVLRCERYNDNQVYYLPDDFNPFVHNQFRFRKQRGEMLVQYESQVIGTFEVPVTASAVGLYAFGVVAAFDMVRVTAI